VGGAPIPSPLVLTGTGGTTNIFSYLTQMAPYSGTPGDGKPAVLNSFWFPVGDQTADLAAVLKGMPFGRIYEQFTTQTIIYFPWSTITNASPTPTTRPIVSITLTNGVAPLTLFLATIPPTGTPYLSMLVGSTYSVVKSITLVNCGIQSIQVAASAGTNFTVVFNFSMQITINSSVKGTGSATMVAVS
jgi:hypothetical protein